MKTILTGVKPTGEIHIGNYFGAMKPAIDLSQSSLHKSFLFIADYHSLTTPTTAETMRNTNLSVAAAWLACGLNLENSLIYKQSDIPEIFELAWILSCFTPKGFMNRAHAYKAKLDENKESGKSDLDSGVNMGLFNYPVLMAADILLFNADEVPVGEDQVQHIEFARDMAQKFNNHYGELIKIPEAVVKTKKVIPGLDGRKMSKSYGNIVPLFAPEKKFRKAIMKIKTDSSAPEDPKDPNNSLIYDLYKILGTPDQLETLANRYAQGIGWGEAKQELFEQLWAHFEPMNQTYNELMATPKKIENILSEGANEVRKQAKPILKNIRKAIGVDF